MIQYLIYLAVLMLIPLWAQMRVRSTYSQYSEVSNSTGMNGAQTARKILDANGLYDVTVKEVAGSLTDHYDPRDKSVNLSTDIYHGASIAGTAVAAHEVGHAIQDANDYTFMRVRSALVPVANLGSNLSYILIIAGMLFGALQLATLGVIFFAAAVLFQLVTLPVEFDASGRALKQIVSLGIVQDDEQKLARKVLSAAAMTYVAAALVSVMELVRFILMITMSNREE
ncbi:zinc metallopeptidase [Sporolactobacillus laevolacticus]|uniref:Zinc metallopeptidase n=1 Tax=Sporolactobacillus laevolacticus DSM 442 TaxID=1395513 RepID=V6IWV9_9BACL|nr:zinc metallopeptidase [Sporolactobacillus laevolacticus]EST11730.1 zinc metallopeptidase [Sporolactobacillus laevolacticus DSM 442]MDF2909625.1 Zn-dependent protease [Sporolactobacillus laevolacticus]MDN3953660.1 zinc metallopeptidase [Sporolactobacillus laevolacticus]